MDSFAWASIFCVVFCRSLLVLFPFAIVLFFLWLTASDYPYDICKLFLCIFYYVLFLGSSRFFSFFISCHVKYLLLFYIRQFVQLNVHHGIKAQFRMTTVTHQSNTVMIKLISMGWESIQNPFKHCRQRARIIIFRQVPVHVSLAWLTYMLRQKVSVKII